MKKMRKILSMVVTAVLMFAFALAFVPAREAKADVLYKNNVEIMQIPLLGNESNTVRFDREIVSVRLYGDCKYATVRKVDYNKLCFTGKKCGRRYVEVVTGDRKLIKCYITVSMTLYTGNVYLRDVTTSKNIKSVKSADESFVSIYRYDDTKRAYAIETWQKKGACKVAVYYTDRTKDVIKVVTSGCKHSWVKVADKTVKEPVFKKKVVKKAFLTWPDGSDASEFYSGSLDGPYSNSKIIGWCQKHCTVCNGKHATQPDPQKRCASTVTCKIKKVTRWVKVGTRNRAVTSHTECRYCGKIK